MESNNSSRWIVIIFAVIALIGFIDTSYLTAEHVRGTIPPCSLVSGCETVLTSRYSVIAGIPLAAIGMAYYAAIVVIIMAFWDSGNSKLLRLVAWLTFAGAAASAYFVYLQAFVINAWCLYCLGSAATSTLLAIFGLRLRRA